MAKHSTVKALVAEIRRLREKLEELEADYAATIDAYQSAWAAREAQWTEAERQARLAREREWERQEAVRALERARARGDTYGEERALRRLRDW